MKIKKLLLVSLLLLLICGCGKTEKKVEEKVEEKVVDCSKTKDVLKKAICETHDKEEIIIYLKYEITSENSKDVSGTLSSIQGVNSIKYFSKDDLFSELIAADKDFAEKKLEDLNLQNPIYVDIDDDSDLASISSKIRELSFVDKLDYGN